VADRILVADDEADIANLVKMVLEAESYQVSTASDGEEALAKTVSEMPDLVLMDVIMPRKTGLEACNKLKQESKTRMIPVVMFTVLGRDIDKRMSKEAGADGHITKPFTNDDLVSEVRRCIEASRSRRFSSALGLTHEQVRQKKILLEYNPATPYESCVRDFTLEATAHGEAMLVISPTGSPICQALGGEKGVELVPLTETTLITPLLSPYADRNLALIYDSLTDIVLSTGSRQAYNFTRKMLENLAEPRFTALFLLNPEAHQQNEVNIFRNLFSEQIKYGEDGLTRVKLT
jgi:CheY-like chemotaxis protein